MVDIKDLVWSDLETGHFNRIIELTVFHNEDLVWYEDTETMERHCMSADIFVRKHKACGLFNEYA